MPTSHSRKPELALITEFCVLTTPEKLCFFINLLCIFVLLNCDVDWVWSAISSWHLKINKISSAGPLLLPVSGSLDYLTHLISLLITLSIQLYPNSGKNSGKIFSWRILLKSTLVFLCFFTRYTLFSSLFFEDLDAGWHLWALLQPHSPDAGIL